MFSSLKLQDVYNGEVISLDQAVDAFLRVELASRSERTREWYARRLSLLARHLGPGRSVSSVMEADLLLWFEQLRDRPSRYVGGTSRPEIEGGLSLDTLHGYVRAVKRFFKWLHKRGILSVDVSEDLRLPKLPRRGPKGISEKNVQAILEAARSSPRDYALLRFLESTGCRRGGIENLMLDDLSLDASDERMRRRVTVREKGGHARTVLLSPGALTALLGWLSVRPPVKDQQVFMGWRPGRGWAPLTADGVTGILRRYKKKLGIKGPVSPHQWRHRFCRDALRRGLNLNQVKQLAGHASITVTALFYADADLDDLQDAYDSKLQPKDF